jgi:RimJ/RimL family protein N-acetyltransferase
MKKEFRVYLRDLRPEDAEISYHWRQNDEIWKGLHGPRYYVSRAYEKHWVLNTMDPHGNQKVWAICLKENHELLGFVYLSQWDRENRTASGGKIIGNPEAWSKGYGTEASLQSYYYGFLKMGLVRVESRQMASNIGARRSAEKGGARTEGRLRRAVYKDGEYHDVNIYGLMKEDFLPWLDIYQFPEDAEEGSR